MSFSHYLCLFVHSGVQHILLCVSVFVLFVFVLCLVYPMLLVSLDCSFVIAPWFSLAFIHHNFDLGDLSSTCDILCLSYYICFSLAVLLKPD